MADYDEVYKTESRHIKSEDVGNKEFKLKISKSQLEYMDKEETDQKVVVYFEGRDKGLALNATNYKMLKGNFGKDSDDWNGKEVMLYVVDTEFGGKPTKGLRLRMVPEQVMEDDDIPF